MADESIDLELKGRTWHVYWYMLSKGADEGVSARELQHALGFSSPSIATHHLERLIDLGLARKNDEGDVVLVGEVKLGVLRHFVRLGRLLVPRYVFYASFTTVFTLAYALFLPLSKDLFASSFVIAIGGFSSGAFWYETYRFWRLNPYQNLVQGVPADRIKYQQQQHPQQVSSMSGFDRRVVKIAATGAIGALVAVLVTALLGRSFGQIDPSVGATLAVLGFAGIAIMVLYSARRSVKAGKSTSDATLEGIFTIVAIGLLFATSMLSGPYLLLVPVVAVVLVVAYTVVLYRRKKEKE